VDAARAERLANEYLADWTRRHGGAVLAISAARESRDHWLFGVAPLSNDVLGPRPQNVVVDKRDGSTSTLGFFAMQAAFEILPVEEVRRFLKPEEIAFLQEFLK
jgi:hypothetical protein